MIRRLIAPVTASTAVACMSDGVSPLHPTRRIDFTQRAQAQLAAAVQGSHARGFEDEILRMEARIPGLGGVSTDAAGNVVVFIKDLSRRAEVLDTLRALAPSVNVDPGFRAKLGPGGRTIVKQGQFGFSELVAFEQAIAGSVRHAGIQSIDADEALNRVRVTLLPGASAAGVLQKIADVGVPGSAVVFDARPPARSLTSLRDRVRPTGGGLQIDNSQHICTLGFNVSVQFYSEGGTLTAAHCALSSENGGVTGDTLWQNLYGSSNRLGIVTINPSWNRTDIDCQGETYCTDADVMYAHVMDSSSGNWSKRLYSVGSWGSNNAGGSITINGNWTGLSVWPYSEYVGMTVYKQGRTTGGTIGTIGATCDNPVVDAGLSTEHVVLCALRVDSARNGTGDSGAPVFVPPSSPDPGYAVGILWAGTGSTIVVDNNDGGNWHCTAGCYYYFSDWNAIQGHLSRYFTP